jgi:hypothetical protein
VLKWDAHYNPAADAAHKKVQDAAAEEQAKLAAEMTSSGVPGGAKDGAAGTSNSAGAASFPTVYE